MDITIKEIAWTMITGIITVLWFLIRGTKANYDKCIKDLEDGKADKSDVDSKITANKARIDLAESTKADKREMDDKIISNQKRLDYLEAKVDRFSETLINKLDDLRESIKNKR